MRGEIISIGDEVTSGQLLDTNSQWLSLRLEELGIHVLYHATVGDEIDAMVEVFQQAFRRSDVIVTTGGLGPTADDLTPRRLGPGDGPQTRLRSAGHGAYPALFAHRKRPMPEKNAVQAMFPEGSRVIPNPNGTAPGIDIGVSRPGPRLRASSPCPASPPK